MSSELEMTLNNKDEGLRVALDSAQMGVYYIDLRTRKVEFSARASQIFGLPALDDDFQNLVETKIHPVDKAEVIRVFEDSIRKRIHYSQEYRFIHTDGSVRWVLSQGKAKYDLASAKPIGFTGVIVEITEKKTQDEREKLLRDLKSQNLILQLNEARIRAFAEAMPQMAWISDQQGNLSYTNKRIYTYLNRDPSTKVHLSEVLHPDDRLRVLPIWAESLKNGENFELEFRLRRGDGEYRWHLARAIALTDESTSTITWYGTNTDIHDQKLFEEKLQRAKDSAEDANQSKSAFLANMSHEIRTPLGAILGFSELLRDAILPAEKNEYAQIISRNGKALTKIIDDILDLSKVEAGRLQLENINFEIFDLVDEILNLFRDLAGAKGVKLQASYDSNLPRTIKSDPTRLRQILINLIGNAVKFTAQGSVVLKIEPLFEKGSVSQIKFLIKDTGVGMTEAQAERLFEPFSQADSSTTRKFGGSGLGLVLSRRLARALGGDVELCACAPFQGCTFSVTIEALASKKSSIKLVLAVATPPVQSAHLPRVLLVEDSPDNQLLVKRLLTRAGLSVEIASNGEEGITKAQSSDFDVILMDMQMPVLDGYAATQKLRASGYRKPIIALTAHAMDDERKKILATGCDAHLTKPIDSVLLLQTIKAMTEKSKHKQESSTQKGSSI